MIFKRLGYFYSFSLLAGLLVILGLAISPRKVEAIGDSGTTIGTNYDYRLDYPDNGIPDDIMTDILSDISARDSRFGHLERYRHMDYYVVGEKSGGTVGDSDFVGYWFIFIENNGTTGGTTPIRARFLRHPDYISYEDYIADDHSSFQPIDRHLNYFFAVDGVDSVLEGVIGYYYNADGTYDHTVGVSGLLPGEHVDVMLFSGTTDSLTYGALGRLYQIGYDGDAADRRYLLHTNSQNYGSEYAIPEIDSNNMPDSGDSGGSDAGFFAWLLEGIISFFAPLFEVLWGYLEPVADFFLNLFEIIWDLIVYIIELFIPLDSETWADMFNQMDEFLRERFPLLYLTYEYTVGIFLRIMDGMNNPVSLLTIPGDFFGTNVTIDFGAIERNAPQAWPILINIVRALFVINALPSILGFFGRMLFKDGGYSHDDKGGE